MKRTVLLSLVVLVAVSCKPQKPWSPYDEDTKSEKPKDPRMQPIAIVVGNEAILPDIGDVEQAVVIEGKLETGESKRNVTIEERRDARDRLLAIDATITPPYPDQLWATYEIKCSRNFPQMPALLRAQVVVDGNPIGTIPPVVLGKTAAKNGVIAKIDLLAGRDAPPESILAKVEGELFLFPVNTDEATLNPETATAPVRSKALIYNPIRVTFAQGAESPGVAPPAG
jgi:hypothetical protein